MKLFSMRLLLLCALPLYTIFLTSCDPCQDCGPNNNYPYFKFQVFNRTSYDTLLVDKTRLSASIKTIEEEISQTTDNEIKEILEAEKEKLVDSLDYYNTLIADTKAFKLKIESINGEEGLFYSELQETDSFSQFRIPLRFNADSTEYSIKIYGKELENMLAVSYDLKDTIINDKITEAAFNLAVKRHDFDSLNGPKGCEKEVCVSNEQTIYVEI